MLNYHHLAHLSAKWEVLYSSRPSTLRNTFVYWFFRVLFNIVILLSILLLITTFSREMWVLPFKEILLEEEQEAMQVMDDVLMTVRVVSIFFIIISGIIVWLSRSAIRRNNYIDLAEDLLNEYKNISAKEYNSNPNNYSPR